MLNTKLSTKADLLADNYISGKQKLIGSYGIAGDGSSFRETPLHIIAHTYNYTTSRAQLTLENEGYNAGILWLNTNGDLRYTTNDGKRFKIDMTQIN